MSSDLSIKDFVQHKEKPANRNRNVHIIVGSYERDKKGVAYAVNGKNMRTGEDVTIRLATAEQYAKFYTSPKEDWNVRLEKSEKAISRRPNITEFASARGSRAVPENGVLTFSDVRVDDDGTLIGRWPNMVVNDPAIEAAVVCDYQVRTGIAGKGTAQQKKIPYILALFSREAVSSEEINREKLDKMFSGKLLDTGSELSTNVTAIVGFNDGTKGTFTLFPQKIKQVGNEQQPFRSPQNVDEVFANTKLVNSASITAATIIAAKAGIDFDQLKFGIRTNADEKYKRLYESVKNGEIKVIFVPGASLHPSKYTSQAILGLKDDGRGNISEAKTNESLLNGSGYVSGVLGIRHTSAETGQVVPAFVKSLFTDDRVPNPKSEFFIRRELTDIAEDIFRKQYGNDQSLEANADIGNETSVDDDNEPDLADEEPSF